MTLALDQNTYNQLLTKFQPKIIENEEEYEQARHLLLNLISNQTTSTRTSFTAGSIITLNVS
jgi:hypothetical protein